jgi:hypothetical protein
VKPSIGYLGLLLLAFSGSLCAGHFYHSAPGFGH